MSIKFCTNNILKENYEIETNFRKKKLVVIVTKLEIF